MAYSAGDTLVRAVMEAASGLPEDRVINDFAFHQAAAVNDADIAAMFALVDEFFRTPTATTFVVSEYISSWINRSATHALQAYKIVDGPLGSPIAEDPWLGPVARRAGSNNLPAEVACVLSFHADLTGVAEEAGAIRPKARRRGRLFIGPLVDLTVTGGDANVVVQPGFRSTLQSAAVRLMDNSEADHPWSVWSRKDKVLRPVVGGWTDNAIDTQRRRGPAATARSTWG